MTSSAPASTSFLYIDCDVPAGQTLTDWRDDREAARRAVLPQRRAIRMLRPPWPRRAR